MTTLIRFIIGFVLTLVLAMTTSCSKNDDNQPPAPTNIETQEDLTSYLDNIIETKAIAGFAITIVQNDAITFQDGFGYADLENQIVYNNQTQNGIASISKTFIGAATVKAIEQGYFSLDTPINDILPVEIINLHQPDAIISIKHLLTHTSGFIDNPLTYTIGNYVVLPNQDLTGEGASILINGIGLEISNPMPLDDYLTEYFLEDGYFYGENNYINSIPGNTWAYSNVASSLMGFVIESATEQSFDEYIKEHILQPLQMTSSTFNVLEVDFSQMAIPYKDKATPLPFYANHGYPEGSIHSTNEDIGKYLLDMTLGIKGESSTLFPSSYYELLFTKQLPQGIVPNEFANNHGVYWYTKNQKWMHGGNSLGISSYMEIADNGSYGYAITSNIDGTFFENETNWEDTKALISQGIEEFISNN